MTAVSNTFIDEYMGTASGEYVKVYLYLLRHEGENIKIPDIADALNHTEADVRRALAYWERTGVLAPEKRIRGRAGDCGDAGDGGRDRKFRREVRRKPSECGICARTGRNERTEIRGGGSDGRRASQDVPSMENLRSRMQETVTTV